MTTPRLRYAPPLTHRLVNQRVFASHPFVLIDVGASGGIEQHWRVFGDQLVAFGFESLIAEAQRLSDAEQNPNITYIAARVTGPPEMEEEHGHIVEKKIEVKNNEPFPRTSAVRARELMKIDWVKTMYDPTGSGVMSEDRVTLDQFFSERPLVSTDFIKIDTDGYDYDVLCGGTELISKSRVLGIFVEFQFHGSVHQHANLFGNIDQFLRARGYSLFDIEVYRCSRATLPKRFIYDFTAQTHGGQVIWGDALYLRDAGSPEYERMWEIHLSPHKVLKLACVFELYGLEDCSAELLQNKRRELESLVDIDHCMDLLTPVLGEEKVGYQEYIRRFERNPRGWFPSHCDSRGSLTDKEGGGRNSFLRALSGLRKRSRNVVKKVVSKLVDVKLLT